MGSRRTLILDISIDPSADADGTDLVDID